MNAAQWFDGCEQPRSAALGPGVFETMRVRCGAVEELDRHLARLERGARALGFGVRGDERAEIERYLLAQGLWDCALRLALEPDARGVHCTLSARAPRSVGPEGVRLVLLEAVRLRYDPLCVHKRTQRGLYEFALAFAQGQGAFDAVLLDEAGALLECATANLHARIEGEWWSPGAPQGVLPGLEREKFLQQFGVWREVAVPREDLLRAEALCLSNRVLGVLPVAAIEGLWEGAPGRNK